MVQAKSDIEEILREVHDPEIPVLSIMDMGIVRDVSEQDGKYLISITPTYSGCPAMDTIADDIKAELRKHDIESEVKLVLSPAWSTDMITERGKKALEDYGIAAPRESSVDKAALKGEKNQIKCTNCGSTNTKMVSRFGSTACKALFKCEDCHEPFDYFKCLK
jgi:ring-1,2-phenylacetyl-CoA epoxidase subunit PaaD